MYLARLLSNLYRSFDKDPAARIVIRARHPDGFCWRVESRKLTVTTFAGDELGEFGLFGKTYNELRDWLEGLGCSIVFFDVESAGLAADTLLPGENREDRSNGDALECYTSTLWAILDSFAVALERVDENIERALKQSRMHLASDEWLDYWGGHFGVHRGQRVLLGGGFGSPEDDQQYLTRIVQEVLRPRVNGLAIENAILQLTGEDVELVETWRRVFILGKSALSVEDRLHDGHYWTWNVIQPVMRSPTPPVNWQEIMRVIERNKPAGTIVASLWWDGDAFHFTHEVQVHFDHESLLERHAYGHDAVLGEMILSDNSFRRHWHALFDGEDTFHVPDALGFRTDASTKRTWLQGGWDSRPWGVRITETHFAHETLP